MQTASATEWSPAYPMEPVLVSRVHEATQFPGYTEAFDAFNEACASYTDWAFRLRSGGELGSYRLEAWKLCSTQSAWVRMERA